MMSSRVFFLCFALLFPNLPHAWHAYDFEKYYSMKHRACSSKESYQRHLQHSEHGSRPEKYKSEWHEEAATAGTECPCFRDTTRPYPQEFIDKLSLWSVQNAYDEQHGETLYGSQEALDRIYRHQHPTDCKNAKYLIFGGWPYGFGSRIHMEGLAMGLAYHLGRIYVPHPDGDNIFWETNIPFCKSISDTSLTCFYRPPTNCTVADMLHNTPHKDINGFRNAYMSDFQSSFENKASYDKVQDRFGNDKAFNLIMTYGGSHWDTHTFLPKPLWDLLVCSPMRSDAFHYWWRAISATYITRPTDRVYDVLASYHSQVVITNPLQSPEEVLSAVTVSPQAPPTTETTTETAPETPPTQQQLHKMKGDTCIAMFVRHGDKGIEMKLHEVAEYLSIAEMMWQLGLVPAAYEYYLQQYERVNTPLTVGEREESPRHHLRGSELPSGNSTLPSELPSTTPTTQSSNTLTVEHKGTITSTSKHDDVLDEIVLHKLPRIPFNGTLFITTEDSTVLDDATAFSTATGWRIAYTNLFDRKVQTAAKTWEEQHKHGTKAVHDEKEYLSMLLNLFYAVQCDAWVCTIASNSCRIIDELRTTIGGKANRVYADLSPETCDIPPCIGDELAGRVTAFGE